MGAKYPFIYVNKGLTIKPKQKDLVFGFRFFRCIRPGQYMYSYDYQLEERWLHEDNIYALKLSEADKRKTICFDETNLPPEGEGYIRLYGSSEDFFSEKELESFFSIEKPSYVSWRDVEKDAIRRKTEAFLLRDDVRAEIEDTAGKAAVYGDRLIFMLLTDTHYVINGNWEYTDATMNAVLNRYREIKKQEEDKGLYAASVKVGEVEKNIVDGIFHLGDFTDGILDQAACREYSHRVIDALFEKNVPVYLCIGNHDANYFRKNPEIMDERQQCTMYLDRKQERIEGDERANKANCYGLCRLMNTTREDVKVLILSAYDNKEKNRYGYSLPQITWAKDVLDSLPKENKVIILSHDAPLTELDYWAKEIRNGNRLCAMLDAWNESRDGKGILAFFHGHTHADFICLKRSFPIISIGCSKIEYFEDRKPTGAVVPVRREGEVTQELWDIAAIDPQSGEIDLVRFGAGEDRHMDGWQFSRMPRPKIWAHRGASGYAPENTLPAFAIAAEMGADGVELDVQMTKDRKIVVIHDELIDRTSDGNGAISQMTLKELRAFNFNRTHPAFGRCEIPLLAEVFELLKSTDLSINIELKTGVMPYPGLEEDLLKLVDDYGMLERIVFSSFSHESVKRIKTLVPDAKCGILFSNGISDVAKYAKAIGMDTIHPATYLLKEPHFVGQAKELGLDVNVWTANTDDDILRLQQMGVHAVITNYPDRARMLYEGIDLSKERKNILERHLYDILEGNNE